MEARRRGRGTKKSPTSASKGEDQAELENFSRDRRVAWLNSAIGDYFRNHSPEEFVGKEKTLRLFKSFLESEQSKTLFVVEKKKQKGSETESTELLLTDKAPAVREGVEKMLYFTKVVENAVSEENFAKEILVGDCNIDPVQQLEHVTQDIFMPLLSNSLNQASWSEIVRKEMMDNIHHFVSNVQITAGLMRGETFLPLPSMGLLPEDDSNGDASQERGNNHADGSGPDGVVDGEGGESNSPSSAALNAKKSKFLAAFSPKKGLGLTASAPMLTSYAAAEEENNAKMMLQKERVHVFEGCIITWTKQIKNVLRLDPETKLKQGLNPGPLEELEFWNSKAANLNSIYEQLRSTRIRKVLGFLDASKSTYNHPFGKLCKESLQAREEANSNVRILAPLKPWLEKLERMPFEDGDLERICELFKPIMHIILMIWKHSEYYNSIARLVVLMREISNAVIERCRAYLNGPRLFEMLEAEEHTRAYEMLKKILKVIGSFKSTYFDYKARANAECVSNPWRMQNNALFLRLDSFLERCHDLLDLTQTITHFSKLNKIEIGGTKGKTLTTSVQQVYLDFENSVQSIKEVSYDVMDVDAKRFDDDFYEFRVKSKELERRIASVLAQGFDDCPTITGRFKLLDSFDQILERPIIQDELENKHLSLLLTYGKDLSLVQQEFLECKDEPPISANMPPTAGALTWCRGLLDRISIPMGKLRELNSSILDREGARDVIKTYTSLVASLADYENKKVQAWEETIESSSISKLKLPLLRRTDDNSQLLAVNFDPALVQLLREVKYFLLLNLKVPENALAIYSKVEEFRRETGNLELMVQKYNKIKTTLLPVERPLVKQHLNKIDKVISQGLKTLTWKSHGIESFISEATSVVQEADDILSTMKDSLAHVEAVNERWAESSMIHRVAKAVSVAEFNSNCKRELVNRYQLITEGGKEVHKLLKEIVKKLKVSAGLPDWKSYVDFVNNIVIQGLVQTACVSLNYLSKETDLTTIRNEAKLPLIEVDLILSSRMVLFAPSLEETSKKDGIRDEVAKWIDSVYAIGNLFKRLDSPTGSYLKEIVQDPTVMQHVASIHKSLDVTIALAEELRMQYCEYEYLWTTDLNAMFSQFLQTAFLPPDDLDSEGEESEEDEALEEKRAQEKMRGYSEAEGSRPNLAKFDERINHFQSLRVKIAELLPSQNVGFLRVNTQPIKQALSTWVTKWIYLFTQYLHDYVIKNLFGLNKFVEDVKEGLSFDVDDGAFDDDKLMGIMKHIRDVRKKMVPMERMFRPLGDTMALLRKHGISFEGDEIGDTSINDFFDHAPDLWDSTVNMAFKAREVIQPKQNQMASKIKNQALAFGEKVREFRNDFLNRAPFGKSGTVLSNPDIAYELLQTYHLKLAELLKEEEDLRELEDLFELEANPAVELDEVKAELGMLKVVWDMYSLVNLSFDSWREILWDQIDTDDLESQLHVLKKQMQNDLPARIEGWPVFEQLERKIKNMSTIIPLIHELHSPAMRERHWKQIMGVTNSQVEKNARFCFQSILELNLHNHVEQVTEIVEVANKELKIDQKLKSIEDVWVSLDLEYVPHKAKNPDLRIIASPEAVIEALEDHQLQLQTLAGLGKFVDYFRERVTNWQKTLGTIEMTLLLWLRVQKTWESLETIFLSSSDIRSELPEDTKRFEVLDQTFKELMMETSMSPNAMATCCADGRYVLLQEMWTSLERCQKALNEYLDQKKNIFPRFYFVSNLALLDILSNGNEPLKIMPHLESCFHGMKTLDFNSQEETAPTDNTRKTSKVSSKDKDKEKSKKAATPINTAVAMISRDGERVDFPHPFKITGAVEHWLNDVTGIMHQTLRGETSNALSRTAHWTGDRPRDAWVFDFPAQVIQLASQVIWTDECRLAIEELDNGSEDALDRFLALSNKRLNALIGHVQGKLTKENRTKIINLITLDVHGREVVEGLIKKKIENTEDFSWQSQLRYYWRDEDETCDIQITDFSTKYSFEYVGNVDRLVITPLTDRCYITLTMALRLTMGGAPAGPAGTGKTETTKDLARCLGLPCYVFNCSDQMNYQTIGDIFKGLAQTGAWGCFDEFNRIPIEVLSVVATQVKTILDAIRHLSEPANRLEPFDQLPAGKPPTKVGHFEFMGTKLALVPTTGFFITMNPGYAGRTELPENLKALFRSCAMIRPDLQPICQNMLMAEGFIRARPLSVKFVTLYKLSSELLSQQPHYDWGLRNVKSVLRVAGKLLRAQPDMDETSILMRALRDFNVPKLPAFDLPIFHKLVDDLFPNLNVSPKFDESLKARAIKACKAMESHQRDEGRNATEEIEAVSITRGREEIYQPEEVFLNKVVNLQEIIDVRHSVMLLGPPGCGKSAIWKTLAKAHNFNEPKPVCVTEALNPKSLTSNELYGFMTLQKDWKDGALSIVMRNMSKSATPYHSYQKHHWIILDGDIDANWIESMNTVMDDNKVLTLVSNERIQLTPKMRLLFEISTLKNATPATVSRAGILYINEEDIGWGPFVESWVQTFARSEFERAQLPQLFKTYMHAVLDMVEENDLKHIVPRKTIAMVQSTCYILEALLAPLSDAVVDRLVLEHLFVFAVIWGVGGSLGVEKSTDNRKKFSQLFLKRFKTVKFPVAASTNTANGGGSTTTTNSSTGAGKDGEGSAPEAGRNGEGGGIFGSSEGAGNAGKKKVISVFDYFFDVQTKTMTPWETKLEASVPLTDSQYFSEMVVPTASSVRLSYIATVLTKIERPVCLVGSAGTGKTTIVKEFLRAISDDRTHATINMNYYTDSLALQAQLEQHVEKRSGKIYGPSGDKKLVYFVDDLNMPYVEEYGTQTPIALIRQFMDYQQWYDRHDLSLKREIQDVQFITAMNHKSGSFTINPRLQRHMTVLACMMPAEADLTQIYQSILLSHLDNFAHPVHALASKCVDAALELHRVVSAKFLPSATKFHYNFNMRDLSAIFQGLLRSKPENFTTALSFVRLFLHESTRVFADRLVSDKDVGSFDSILLAVSKKYFEEEPEEMFERPLIFTEFIRASASSDLLSADLRGQRSGTNGQSSNQDGAEQLHSDSSMRTGGSSSAYICARSFDEVQQCLEEHLGNYNQSKAKMDLVLFTLATEHVCRIARIIGMPGGNALLVGVGGSGKQSLSRLASFICGFDVFQFVVTADFTCAEFKENLKGLYRRAGLRPGSPVVLLLTDSQITDERFLVYINDILSSGYIPDLFTPDEFDGIFASLRMEAKSNGIPNTRSHMMEFFIKRVRSALHIILCHSPVGDTFRIRARKFPGLINCTSIDWFHPWPREALVAVAGRFLAGINFGSDDIAENVMHHIAEVHLSVTEASQKYLEIQKRYNYVTPKSFLELVSFYRQLLGTKRSELKQGLDRLRAGLETLRGTAKDVAGLQEDLKMTMGKVEERKEATEELLEQMGQQRAEARVQQEVAAKERIRAEKFAAEAKEIEESAEVELAAAQPAMDQAEEAVNCLTKASLTELKSLTKPPAGVDKVTTCVLMMIKNEKRNFSWDNAKRMMANIDKFKQSLEEYDAKNIPEELIERISPIVNDPEFTYEKLMKKSAAAANMATWVINIVEFNKIYKKVKPLMDRLDAARLNKEEAMADLQRVEEQLKTAESHLNELQENFMHATNEKSKVEYEAAVCTERLQLAERLVNGLASENERWEKEIENLQYRMETIVGDTLLGSAFVSYIGAFDSETRLVLWRDIWTNDILSREIPLSEGVTPLKVITDDAEVAQWGMEGLPADPFSIENGALITSCVRWPLIIDPQLQGIQWLRSRHGTKETTAPSTAKKTKRRNTQRKSTVASSSQAQAAQLAQNLSQNQNDGNSSETGMAVHEENSQDGLSMAGSVAGTPRSTASGGKGTGEVKSSSNTLQRQNTKRRGVAGVKELANVPEIEANSFVVIQTSQKNWLQVLAKAIECGAVAVIENIGETIDSVIEPLLSRSFSFKGRQPFLRLGTHEVEFDPNFRLILQTRLSNPHYKPEMLAQCTLINFIVTESGLEDQLLARVVNSERPELEKQKQELQLAFNKYKIQLMELEDSLLEKLSNAPPDILSDVPMIESLEATKQKANDVEQAVLRGKETEKGINEAREAYRPVAVEAAMLYFLLLQLGGINHMYQYSLDSFLTFFEKAMSQAESRSALKRKEDGGDDSEDSHCAERVEALAKSVRLTIFKMVSRGLFVRHKMVFLIQMTFNLLKKEIIPLRFSEDRFDSEGLNFLLRAPQKFDMDNEIDWLPDNAWQTVCGLAEQKGFEQLPADMIESAPRFKEWYNHVNPEHEKLPLDWRELDKRPFLKILVVRALRPDRTLAALSWFVRQTLPDGHLFTDCDAQLNSYQVLQESFEDSRSDTPIYLIQSPGSNVVAEVDRLAQAKGMVYGSTYFNISLGQGQDVIAMETLESASRQGWWVLLNNVHLMPRWLLTLSKKLDELATSGSCHKSFRLFLSSDPSTQIPVSILNRCIKLTNEPPAGLRANLTRAWAQFSPTEVDGWDGKTRSILFGLCYFHSVMLERKTYLHKGFNVMYPFSIQDLSACSTVLRNYMDKHTSNRVPWEDLRYLFGEIIYGGHIVNDFDRRLCNTYLEYFMNDQLLEELDLFPFSTGAPIGDHSLVEVASSGGGNGPNSGAGAGGDGEVNGNSSGAPGGRFACFKTAALPSHEKYLEHIYDNLPGDTPMAFGLHPNAELGFRSAMNNSMFQLLQSLQRSDDEEEGDGQSAQHIAEAMLQDMLETYRDVFLDTESVLSMIDTPDPFQNMYLQECQRMQTLIAEMVRSLVELELGFKGDLTMTESMEKLMDALYQDRVPEAWIKISYPSERPLGSWLSNLQHRITQLQDWLADPTSQVRCTWISGFFNPNAFLTAILQTTARASSMELDKLVISTEVLKRRESEIEEPSRDGAYVTGLYLEGARWDFGAVCLTESRPKEIICSMPVINIKAVPAKEFETGNVYNCPVYRTQNRAQTYVFTANLKTKMPPAKWILAGVALLMDPSE